MSNQTVECKHGFTLIELSIVIVVIGLIIGGVLVGQDLIKMSEARALMSQMDKYQVAVHTFQLKYNCKPGDCKNATILGLGPDGNGDKYLGDTVTNGSNGRCLYSFGDGGKCLSTIHAPADAVSFPWLNRHRGEQQYFWVHLANAELIEGEKSAASINDITVGEADMNLYFPKTVHGKGYLAAFMWNGKLFFRTGLKELNQYKHGNCSAVALNASQMKYIADKKGYGDIVVGGNVYESLLNGQKVVPLGTVGSVNGSIPLFGAYFHDSTYNNLPGHTPCAISDGAGGYQYNIQNNGSCNLMWELDY